MGVHHVILAEYCPVNERSNVAERREIALTFTLWFRALPGNYISDEDKEG